MMSEVVATASAPKTMRLIDVDNRDGAVSPSGRRYGTRTVRPMHDATNYVNVIFSDHGFSRAMLCISAAYAVARCLSVRLVRVYCRNE